MKNIYIKLCLALLVCISALSMPAHAQCTCTEFRAQVISIASPAGQCCYAVQIQQQYPAQSNCRPVVIKLAAGISGTQFTAAPGWQLYSTTPAGSFFTITPSGYIPSSTVWNTVATFCSPKCNLPGEIIVEWLKDVGAPTICKTAASVNPCQPIACDLTISNSPIVCSGTPGNYAVTYTLQNNSCLPCNAGVTLNSAFNTLQPGTTFPVNQVIPVGGSITQTIHVTATPGSAAFYMNVCCVNPAGSSKCCIKDSIPWPTCITCDTAYLTADKLQFCDQGATTLRALNTSGLPVSTNNIRWYRAPAPCPPLPTDPTGNLAPGWTLFQSSGNTATTSSPLLTASTCYIAFVNENSNCSYWTKPLTIVIQQTPVITSIQDRDICDPSTSPSIKAPSQQFTIPFTSGQSVKWYQSADCVNYTPVPPANIVIVAGTSIFNTGGLNGSTTANPCDTITYCYRAVVNSKNCGSVSRDFRVKVFSVPKTGKLLASPATVCNGKASTITRIPGCGKIVKWERSSMSSSSSTFTGWTDITPLYGTANNFSTNNLYNNTNCVMYIAYRVTVENGACSPANIDRPTIIVQVLPDLKPVIQTPGNAICMGPGGMNLTCNFPTCASSLYPLPQITYTWYRDSPAPIGTGSSVYHANLPGTYWVTVSNGCNTWTSAPVTICSRPVITLPPGCICRRPPSGGPYNLPVQISGGCTNCTYTIRWQEFRNGSLVFTGTATGLTSGGNIVTIPANRLPALNYGDVLRFRVVAISSSCGASCLPGPSNMNIVSVCPQ